MGEKNKIVFDLSQTHSINYLDRENSYYFGKLEFIEVSRNQPKYLLSKKILTDKLKCPNCESYYFNLNLENRINSNIIANKLPASEIKRVRGLGFSYKIESCVNCNNKYYFGFGYHERQPGLELEFVHNIIEIFTQHNNTIVDIIEGDDNNFEYFKNAIKYGVNFYEFNFIFGDLASAKIFYLEKSKCKNSTEAVVRLVIPYLYHTGHFRKSDLMVTESIFDIVKQDLKMDIYFNTKLINGNIKQLKKDLQCFFNVPEIEHYKYDKNGKWIEKKSDLSEILNECTRSIKSIQLTEWNNPNFEYFLETDKYFVLYNFSTGA